LLDGTQFEQVRPPRQRNLSESVDAGACQDLHNPVEIDRNSMVVIEARDLVFNKRYGLGGWVALSIGLRNFQPIAPVACVERIAGEKVATATRLLLEDSNQIYLRVRQFSVARRVGRDLSQLLRCFMRLRFTP